MASQTTDPLSSEMAAQTIDPLPSEMASKPCSSSSLVLPDVAVESEILDIKAIEKSMFKKAMEGHWEEILAEYKEPRAQEVAVTRWGDTVLHLAVFDGEVEIVKKLVAIIRGDEASHTPGLENDRGDILKKKNGVGDTVLHVAAAVSNVEMCECIVGSDSGLMAIRNDDNETPLFVAARQGNKEAFLWLHSKCDHDSCRVEYCKRKDDEGKTETVLHSAINGEHFDLAYEIIRVQEDLVHVKNDEGLSPLHLLASKPNAFKSGTRYGRLDRLIYSCIVVDHSERQSAKNNPPREEEYGFYNYFPKNYTTCLHVFQMLKKLISVIVGSKQVKHSPMIDTENPKLLQKNRAGGGSGGGGGGSRKGEVRYGLCSPPSPPNHIMCFNFFKLVFKFARKALSIFLELGFQRARNVKVKKEMITCANRVMEELIERISETDWEEGFKPGGRPENWVTNIGIAAVNVEGIKETPILIAAKMGVTEMIEKILDKFPMAIQDLNSEEKNIVLLAVENRQILVYELLLKRKILDQKVFCQLDEDGNSALHLAAAFGDYRPWLIPGAALQIQWEIRWFKFVQNSKPKNYFAQYNDYDETAEQIFTDTHEDLIKQGGTWLINTSQSCSVVAALIATVAFATAATVPGGLTNSGAPALATEPAFKAFAISSLIALCFSVTSVIMFLAILTSRYEEQDFASNLPNKLIVALSSLFISIASMLVSFCVGHVFVLGKKLIYAAYPFYILTSLSVAFFILGQFPIIDMIKATFSNAPQRGYKVNRIKKRR